MLVALAVVVLVRVLTVRIRMLFDCLVPVPQVGVRQRHEHQDEQDRKNRHAEDPRCGPQRSQFFMFGDGRADLLEQHFLPLMSSHDYDGGHRRRSGLLFHVTALLAADLALTLNYPLGGGQFGQSHGAARVQLLG